MSDTQYYPIPPDEIAALNKQREWVRGHFSPESVGKYDSWQGKLRVITIILENKWVQPQETWKLQSLGVTLGDIVAETLQLQWTLVRDEYGATPALYQPGTSLVLFPITMISKRIERGEDVDMSALLSSIGAGVAEARARLAAEGS